ncbi:hypothetical protein UMM65_07405 [Aureibaculum sp. 2210JD6-5]|uniref:hypothetical protein n=1 Tax=Aureibaculum sp. 2210JD6-5 TaxID=3103957 RepID=UPI002AAE6FBD|nr:hypothetical protein [Aureibaculum sp. 2210JD6-5]MDY7395063.1 hypothetical protein [Aureibaculum sp. 2210JD6-5]
MKKILLLGIAVIAFNFNSWSQPDYAEIRFYSTIKEYKKTKPNIETEGFNIQKEDISTIISLLGSSFYNDEEINDITEKIWLALIDPKKFDYVFKDIAVQSIPNWNKKNFKGEIVIEPNPFLAKWTNAQNDLVYFKEALGQLLTFYKLMGYSEEAKGVKKALANMLHTEKYKFRPIRSDDWTSYYLNSANAVINPKGLIAMQSNFDFFVCKKEKKDSLVALFEKMDWHFSIPEK